MSRNVVCPVEDLPEGGHVIIDAGGRGGVGVYNIKGHFVAVRNVSPHAGALLCAGILTGASVSERPPERTWAHDGEILKCPWHVALEHVLIAPQSRSARKGRSPGDQAQERGVENGR